MDTIYEFNKDERRVVQAAYQRYQQVIQVIAELHELTGSLNVDPNVGFLRSAAEPASAGEPSQKG